MRGWILSTVRLRAVVSASVGACAAPFVVLVAVGLSGIAPLAIDEAHAQGVALPPLTVEAKKQRPARTSAPKRPAATQPRLPARSLQDTPTAPSASPESARGPVKGYIAKQSATGAKTDTPVIETPQSLSVVPADQIRTQNAQTIGQALRYVPGIVAEMGGGNDGARYDFQTLRGFAYVGQHYVDGLKATFGVGNLSMAPFDPYFLERIEVLRGPASVLYGQNTPGGIINMISKRPLDELLREVTLQVGTHQRVQAGFDFSGNVDKAGTLQYRLTGLGRRAENQVDFVEEERFSIAPSLRWNVIPGTSITIYGSYQRDPKGGYYGNLIEDGVVRPLPGGGYFRRSFNTGDPSFDHFEREQYHAGIELDHRISDVWSLRHHSRYIHSDASARAFFAGAFVPPSTISRSTLAVDADTSAFTTDTQFQADFATGAARHKLLFGIDYLRSKWNNRQGVGQGPPFGSVPPIDIFDPIYGLPVPVPDGFPNAFMLSDATQIQDQVGLYVQEQLKIDRFVLTLGGRYDWATNRNEVDGWIGAPPALGGMDASVSQKLDSSAFSGRAGLTYLFDNGFAPYVSYSTSFLPVLGFDSSLNAFKPVEGEQWEAGLKYVPPGWNALFTAAIFDARQKNALVVDPAAVVPCPGGTPCQTQAGEVRARGLELEGKIEISPSFNVIGS